MNVVASLKEERDRLQQDLNKINEAIRILDGNELHTRTGVSDAKVGGGHISAAGRKRLSELMKKRWAERRKAKAGAKKASAK